MRPDSTTVGIALLCDPSGVVKEVLYNELGLNTGDVIGKPFPQLVDSSSMHKALSFMMDVRTKGSVFNCELNLPIKGAMALVHCVGQSLGDDQLVMAARTSGDVNHLFDEMMRINSDQTVLLRTTTKQIAHDEQRQQEYRHFDDLTKLNNEMAVLHRELGRKNGELERLYAEVQRLSITDILTGLYNRRGYFELGEKEIARSRRYGEPLSAIMFDLDHFKKFNDTYGHATGDIVLKGVAERCTAQLRNIDIFGRYGGEEFSVLLPGTNLAGAGVVAERMRDTVNSSVLESDQGALTVSISLGVAELKPNTVGMEALLNDADKALYRAKELGRNRVCLENV